MATRFKMLTSVDKSEAVQGKIYYTCRNFAHEPGGVQSKIVRLCLQAGGAYQHALLDFLTTDKSWGQIVMEHHISPATLDRARRRFYSLW